MSAEQAWEALEAELWRDGPAHGRRSGVYATHKPRIQAAIEAQARHRRPRSDRRRPPMTRAIAAAAILVLAWAVLRRRPVEPPEDEVQPPDPRTVYLATRVTFPDHDPAVLHVDGTWSLDCRGCEARHGLVRIFREAKRRGWD